MGNLTNPGNYQLAVLGQFGSTFLDNNSTNVKPPTGKVFVAITMLADCTFDTTDGLVSEDGTVWASTATSSIGSGTGGETVTVSYTFPKGVTIFGRYTEIDLATGTCIAYIG
tara:strand:+ start:101 stop:436 length:336 start_codon:yes stop_codon:yes gene_type:complete